MTSSVTGLGPRNLSSSQAAARSDSYLSASLKSVVVALSRRAPMITSEITTATTQMPTTTNGLRALKRASDSVKGSPPQCQECSE